jgi:hypothetical protein
MTEKVVLGRRQIDKIIIEKIPVYEAQMNGDQPQIDPNGIGFLKLAGGVMGGEVGVLAGPPMKIYKSTLQFANRADSVGGNETTSAFPVYLEKYNKTVWLPLEYVHSI